FHESCFEYVMRRPPLSTPSPYTTLFRSFEHGVLLANAGLPTPWDALRAAAAEQGERFMAAPLGEAHAWLGADIMMGPDAPGTQVDRKSTRLNSSHVKISYAVFCLKKKRK